MTSSQLPEPQHDPAAQLVDVHAAIQRLSALVAADPKALVPASERGGVDLAILASLRSVTSATNTQPLHSLLDQFSANDDRRPATAADVVMTLQLLAKALDQDL